jgi:nuclear cap-binding protein subunit 1
LAFDSTLCEALQHNLQSLVPPPHHPSTLYPLPTVIFRWAELSTLLRVCISEH